MVVRMKLHHPQDLDKANSVEIKHNDIEKLQQNFLIVPEGTENSSIIEKDVTASFTSV